jgi:hypothetical protein
MAQFTKQPAEAYTIAIDYTDRLPVGVALSSRVVLGAKLTTDETFLAVSAAVDSSTIFTVLNVGIGAILTIEPGTAKEEIVIVQSTAGSSPSTCVLMSQLSNDHDLGARIVYYPGATDEVIGTTTPVVGNRVQAKVQRGQHGNNYHLMFLTTLSNGDVVEDDVIMTVEDQ